MSSSLHSDLYNEIHMCREAFSVFFVSSRGTQNYTTLIYQRYIGCSIHHLQSSDISLPEWCGESVGERRSTLPTGCFHSSLRGGRTSSALGMCVDTQNSDHVMAWSLGSSPLTFRVRSTHWSAPNCPWRLNSKGLGSSRTKFSAYRQAEEINCALFTFSCFPGLLLTFGG